MPRLRTSKDRASTTLAVPSQLLPTHITERSPLSAGRTAIGRSRASFSLGRSSLIRASPHAARAAAAAIAARAVLPVVRTRARRERRIT
ncbi:hypothetical protein D9M68_974100 [compost metagenome]